MAWFGLPSGTDVHHGMTEKACMLDWKMSQDSGGTIQGHPEGSQIKPRPTGQLKSRTGHLTSSLSSSEDCCMAALSAAFLALLPMFSHPLLFALCWQPPEIARAPPPATPFRPSRLPST
eukprot:1141482-Pelagomonas_calceolata.AAC.1